MVVRSEQSLRRSSRRSEQAPGTTPVKQGQHPPSSATLNPRAKRARISSLTESGSLAKRQKTEEQDIPSRYKIPLRSRQPRQPLSSVLLQNGTELVSAGRNQKISNGDSSQQQSQERTNEQSNPDKVLQLIEKRSLRSHDGGSRSKSELSHYFTNYEQMISLETPKPGKSVDSSAS
jgi:hypothetical protein